MDKLDEVKEWIKKAEADFEGAMHLSRRRKKPLPDLVCFHCQQCAEKYLKAYLIFNKTSFPKTHDLLLLLEILIQFYPTLELHRELFEYLNPYSVQFRYPGEESSIEEAKQALSIVKKIRTIIKENLPDEVSK